MADEPQAQDTRGLNHEPAEKTVADIHAARRRGVALSDAQQEWLKGNAKLFAEFPQPTFEKEE